MHFARLSIQTLAEAGRFPLDYSTMPKRSSKGSNPEDVNETAYRVLREATGEPAPEPEKNPSAVALGRLGGKKGGPARAAKLSPKKRQQIARKAAMKRWHPPEA
jgi:hypothetical protein